MPFTIGNQFYKIFGDIWSYIYFAWTSYSAVPISSNQSHEFNLRGLQVNIIPGDNFFFCSYFLELTRMKGVLIIFCCISIHTYCQPANCSLKKQAEGIKVYTCKNEHEKFKTLKAEFLVKNTSMAELKKFLMRVEHYPTWQYKMIHAEVIQNISENEISYISEIDAPWPIEDRETVINFKVTHGTTSNFMQIDMRSFQYNRHVKDGFIRVPFMHGHWNVKSATNSTLEVEYILRIDPGGTLPVWLVNLSMAEGPYISFKKLKKQLEKQ